ncbi:MAG: helix-turn-helix transcriptional regulator [Acidimicrobiales bacterium]
MVDAKATLRAGELADLLRARRARLQPEDVGLPAGRRRRTPGLRREEVASLAAISTTYYTFLEQGRDIRPSRQVLDSLASALRLVTAERVHLHHLVYDDDEPAALPEESVSPAVVELIDRLDPAPAYLTGRRYDVLLSNRTARALWTDWTACDADQRNIVWWTLTDPEARTILIDWEDEAASALARYRAAADRHPNDPAFTDLTERLHEAVPEVRKWWADHTIAPLSSGTKRLHHPRIGDLELTFVVLQVAEHPSQTLVAFTPTAQDETRIARLIEPGSSRSS